MGYKSVSSSTLSCLCELFSLLFAAGSLLNFSIAYTVIQQFFFVLGPVERVGVLSFGSYPGLVLFSRKKVFPGLRLSSDAHSILRHRFSYM